MKSVVTPNSQTQVARPSTRAKNVEPALPVFQVKIFAYSEFLESSQSKRVSSAQKGASIRRGRNFSKCFRIDTELNKKYEQED
jgi:hypothetical protein